MREIKIIVDSTCDLDPAYIAENNIHVIPLQVIFGQDTYHDGVNLTVSQLYDIVDKTDMLPKTSAIGPAEFVEVFKKYIDEDYDIIFIGISSKFSSVIQNARLAAEEFPGRVVIHDSYNLSTGIGLQVIKAVKYRSAGLSLKEIENNLLQIVPKVRAQFGVESLTYLYKGGRCSGTAYFFGRGLKLKPIIRVVDGGMIVYKKPRGKMINSLNALLDIFKEDLSNVDLDCVIVTHSLAPESADYLISELSKIIDPKILKVTCAGCVISSHCGPGTIGILYILK